MFELRTNCINIQKNELHKYAKFNLNQLVETSLFKRVRNCIFTPKNELHTAFFYAVEENPLLIKEKTSFLNCIRCFLYTALKLANNQCFELHIYFFSKEKRGNSLNIALSL